MDGLKPWYFSRTIWASLAVVVTAVAGLFGLSIDSGDAQALVDAVLQALTAVAGIAAIVGRVAARSRIG